MRVHPSVMYGTAEQIAGVLNTAECPPSGLTGISYKPPSEDNDDPISIIWMRPEWPMMRSQATTQVVVGPAVLGWSYALMAPLRHSDEDGAAVDTLDRSPGNVLFTMEDFGLLPDASDEIRMAMTGAFSPEGIVHRSLDMRDLIMPSTGEHDRLCVYRGRTRHVLQLPGDANPCQLTAGYLPGAPDLVLAGRKGGTMIYGNDSDAIWLSAPLGLSSCWHELLALPAPLARIGRVNANGLVPIHLMNDQVLMVRSGMPGEIVVRHWARFPSDYIAQLSGDQDDGNAFNSYFGLSSAVVTERGEPTCGFVRQLHSSGRSTYPLGAVLYTFARTEHVPTEITGL